MTTDQGSDGPEATVVTLGPEYDDELRESLMAVLRELGARKVDSSWGVGGSQELARLQVEVDGEIVTIESETYMGLSVQGSAELVGRIADVVRERIKSA